MARLTIFFNSSKAKQIINLDDRFFLDEKSKTGKKLIKSEAESKAKSVAMDIAGYHYFGYDLEAEEFYFPVSKK